VVSKPIQTKGLAAEIGPWQPLRGKIGFERRNRLSINSVDLRCVNQRLDEGERLDVMIAGSMAIVALEPFENRWLRGLWDP